MTARERTAELMTDRPTWTEERGSLVLPGTGFEIRPNEKPGLPFVLHSPCYEPMAYWSLENAKHDGERYAAKLTEST